MTITEERPLDGRAQRLLAKGRVAADKTVAEAHAEAIRLEAQRKDDEERQRIAAEAELLALRVRAQAAATEAAEEQLRIAQAPRLDQEAAEAEEAARVAAADARQRRADRLVTALLIAGTAAALIGQVGAFVRPLGDALLVGQLDAPASSGWTKAGSITIALVVGLVLETVGLFAMSLAHAARVDGDSPAVYRAVAWGQVAFAAFINLKHWSPAWTELWQPDVSLLGAVFGGLSVLSVLGWELREHRAARRARKEEIRKLWKSEPVPPRPEFGAMRWVVAHRQTRLAWQLAVKHRITSAEDALRMADEVLAAVEPSTRLGLGGRLHVLVLGYVRQPLPKVEESWLAKMKRVRSERVEAQESEAAPAAPTPQEIPAASTQVEPVLSIERVPSDEEPQPAAHTVTESETTRPLPRAVPKDIVLPTTWDELVAEGVRCAREHMDGNLRGTGKRDELAKLVRRRKDLELPGDSRIKTLLINAVKGELERGAA
ncbi:MAG: hypothetical protein K0R87_3526 [Pseudonocardia sp.]|nr:hypothetical protein [Pseudonocardia sp.]